MSKVFLKIYYSAASKNGIFFLSFFFSSPNDAWSSLLLATLSCVLIYVGQDLIMNACPNSPYIPRTPRTYSVLQAMAMESSQQQQSTLTDWLTDCCGVPLPRPSRQLLLPTAYQQKARVVCLSVCPWVLSPPLPSIITIKSLPGTTNIDHHGEFRQVPSYHHESRQVSLLSSWIQTGTFTIIMN